MGTVNAAQCELDFDRILPENPASGFTVTVNKTAQKPEPAMKTTDAFILKMIFLNLFRIEIHYLNIY
jgi:hypothetical protein